MKQILIALQKLYESKVLEADHQIKLYSNQSSAVNEHSDLAKELYKWITIKSDNEGKLRQVLTYIPKESNTKKDGK